MRSDNDERRLVREFVDKLLELNNLDSDCVDQIVITVGEPIKFRVISGAGAIW